MPVREVMTRQVISVAPDATVDQVIELLLRHQVSGLPVVDDEQRLGWRGPRNLENMPSEVFVVDTTGADESEADVPIKDSSGKVTGSSSISLAKGTVFAHLWGYGKGSYSPFASWHFTSGQDGSGDLDNLHGNWPLANQQMASSLRYMGYDYKFAFGDGAHNDKHGSAILADSLRWLWRGEK